MKYCVFIDILGYAGIVTNSKLTEHQKLNILNGIYANIGTQIMFDISEARNGVFDKIYIKSFSDSIYLESDDLHCILHAVKNIFGHVFAFYGPSKLLDFEYTALFRAGISKNWTTRFHDIASLVDNNNTLNPVGLGIAEAYGVSEKTFLSGMRIIINRSVFRDLTTNKITIKGKEYYSLTYTLNGAQHTSYFKEIKRNDVFNRISLYELIWSCDLMNTCTTSGIDILKHIKGHFPKGTTRHYKKTAEVLYHGLLLSNCSARFGETYIKQLNFLKSEKKSNFIIRLFYPVHVLIKQVAFMYTRMWHKQS